MRTDFIQCGIEPEPNPLKSHIPVGADHDRYCTGINSNCCHTDWRIRMLR